MKKITLYFSAIFILLNSFAFASQWNVKYNGPGNGIDEIRAMTVDNAGNVYVTGSSYIDSVNGSDYVTIKYNTNGVLQWLASYNGPGNGEDIPHSIFIDNAGYVYITGSSNRVHFAIFDLDATTIKYSPQGVQLWVARYDGVLHQEDAGNVIKVDANENVIITGYTTVSNGAYSRKDFLTIKYNSSGVEQWVKTHNGPGNKDDVAVGLGLDGAGNVYVTGTDFAGPDPLGENDFFTIKYSTSGTELWTARFNGTISEADAATGIAVDDAGNVVVTGSSRLGGTDNDFITIKYNTNGVKQWQRQYGGAAGNGDTPYAITMDNAGNIYITGSDQKVAYNYDIRTLKYSAAGVLLWSKRYNGPVNGNDGGNAVTTDASGNVYVTGQSMGNSFSADFVTLKYNNSGVQQWVRRFNGGGNDEDAGVAVNVDGNGNVYVAGYSTGAGSNLDFRTIKYSPSGMKEDFGFENDELKSPMLSQNFPNPFNETTIIDYYLPEPANVTFIITDMLGNKIKTTSYSAALKGKDSIEISKSELLPGYYFYTLIAGDFEESKRMLIVK